MAHHRFCFGRVNGLESQCNCADVKAWVERERKNAMCDGAKPLEYLEGSTFVATLDGDDIPLAGELLITVFDNRICRIAYREQRGDTWQPPVEAELRT